MHKTTKMAMSKWNIFLLSFIISVLFFSSCTSDEEFEGLSMISLEHTFGAESNPIFTKRGTITLRSLKGNVATYSPEGSLSVEDMSNLKTLVEEDGIYRVRIISQSGSTPQYVSSFVKACSLYESALSDILTVNVDSSGSILGLSISTVSPYCHGTAVDETELLHFNTTVEVHQTAIGPEPKTKLYIQKLEMEAMEKEKGQQGDNRSFFAKYWMYIAIFFVVMMFASGQDQGGQGGGGGGRN